MVVTVSCQVTTRGCSFAHGPPSLQYGWRICSRIEIGKREHQKGKGELLLFIMAPWLGGRQIKPE